MPPAKKKRTVAELETENARLERENRRLSKALRSKDTETSLVADQQEATAEILRTIASSPIEAERALETIAQTTARIFDAASVTIRRVEGNTIRMIGSAGPAAGMLGADIPERPVDRHSLAGLLVLDKKQIYLTDPGVPGDIVEERTADIMRRANIRSIVATPLIREGEVIGTLVVHRVSDRPFTEMELGQLQSFADQAVIAIENARLLSELNARNRDLAEALERQTATADILRVIASTPGEPTHALDTISETAARMFRATDVGIRRLEGGVLKHISSAGGKASLLRASYPDIPHDVTTPQGQCVVKNCQFCIDDVLSTANFSGPTMAAARSSGIRSAAFTPLTREDVAISVMAISRNEVRPFAETELELMHGFADQAVIAIENARLLNELNARNRDLRESLDQQTATSDILRAIASTPADADAVLQTIADTAQRLFEVNSVRIARIQDGVFHDVASAAPQGRAHAARLKGVPVDRGTVAGLAAVEGRIVYFGDMKPHYEDFPRAARGSRTIAAAPLMLQGETIGTITISRQREVLPFTDKQLAMLASFADQAVIAIENAGLLTELRSALERQTASAHVLQAIASEPGRADEVLHIIAETANSLFAASSVHIQMTDEDRVGQRIAVGPGSERIYAHFPPRVPPPNSLPGAIISRIQGVQVPDLDNLDPDIADWPGLRVAREAGARTIVGAPLRREGQVIGVIMALRDELKPFDHEELALLQSLADQAVIAIENARLLAELREARDAAEGALVDLRAAQANLVQAEKMASLGQLTAGIAHEIKNPLNFVNNFAGLSVELLDELKEAQAAAIVALGADKQAEIDEIASMLTSNLEKIAEHGRRADGIVKSMLAHSRGGSGERQEVNLNALVEEALNLAYHGARAQDQEFNITMEREFDPALGPIDVVPQDLTRVFLNLFGNGFYAANKRHREGTDGGFAPTLKVSTWDLGTKIVIRVRDNGIGIAPEVRDKLFQPFFTTKPTGEGTGLGLSISYEIVTREHGGTIEVESQPGEFTEFTITIPKRFEGSAGPRDIHGGANA